jgi:hypothetical protein
MAMGRVAIPAEKLPPTKPPHLILEKFYVIPVANSRNPTTSGSNLIPGRDGRFKVNGSVWQRLVKHFK